jgi:hypothetical protein
MRGSARVRRHRTEEFASFSATEVAESLKFLESIARVDDVTIGLVGQTGQSNGDVGTFGGGESKITITEG